MDITTQTTKPNAQLPRQRVVLEGIIFLCVLLFAYTAFSKLIELPRFLGQIRSAPFIGPYSGTVIWAVPVAELMVAMLMTWPRTRLVGLYLFVGMMAAFTAYIIYIIRYASHIPCSCGGVLEAMGWGDHLVFNSLFILIGSGALLLVRQATKKGRHQPPLRWHDIKNLFRKKQGKAENL